MSDIRVLVIDDEEMVAKMLKSFLELYEISVDTAFCGDEALKLISLNDYTVAIVDMRLPDTTGTRLIIEAHKLKPDLKYLIHTGSIEYSVGEDLKSIGMDNSSILNKPVTDMTIIYEAILKKAEGA